MALRRRTRFLFLGLLALLAFSPVSPLSWLLARAYYAPAKREAMAFCESLVVPQIEATWHATGAYPVTPDPAWTSGRPIPKLIRPKHFYTSTGSSYTLYFWTPDELWDGFWALDGTTKKWSNFDANLPRD